MAMYDVFIKVLRRNSPAPQCLRMRSPDSETPEQFYNRAIKKLYGKSHWFHRTNSQHPMVGQVAWPCSRRSSGAIEQFNVGDVVRIDTVKRGR
jgi:hypothetical protein